MAASEQIENHRQTTITRPRVTDHLSIRHYLVSDHGKALYIRVSMQVYECLTDTTHFVHYIRICSLPPIKVVVFSLTGTARGFIVYAYTYSACTIIP